MSNKNYSRKLKYGTAAVVLTVVFCVVVIFINAIISVLDQKIGLYVDLTNEQLYEISDASRQALEGVERDIEIIFCQVADKVDEDWYLSKVKNLAEKFKNEYDNISVKYIDIAADPTAVYQFKTTSSTSIPNTSVIVSCPETKAFKVLPKTTFFSIAQSDGRVFGFNGEIKLVSAFLYTAKNNRPLALITTGHGETLASQGILDLLDNAGYELKSVDLATQDIDKAASLLIISNPQNDFIGISQDGSDKVNEIQKLRKFVTEDFGNIMVFINPQTPELPELSEFLGDDFGLGYTPGSVVVDKGGNSLDVDGYAVIGVYGDEGYAQNLHNQISTTATAVKTVSETTTPISILYKNKNYTETSVALWSPHTSVAYVAGKESPQGQYPLVAMSSYVRTLNNEQKKAHVIVFGSAYFVDDLYVNSAGASSYGNADMFYSALKFFGNEADVTNIKSKIFDDNSITVDVTTRKNITIVLTLVIPALILALGTFIWYKRKKS